MFNKEIFKFEENKRAIYVIKHGEKIIFIGSTNNYELVDYTVRHYIDIGKNDGFYGYI